MSDEAYTRAGVAVLGAAAAHWRARIGEELRSIEVPEWELDGEPVRVYWRPVLNMREREQIDRKLDAGRIAYLVESLLVRARDAEGRPLWRELDRERLMREADSDVVLRVVEAMAGEPAPTLEAAEKNSERTAP
jgi:hypothetical protein